MSGDRVLVCGGRDYNSEERVCYALDRYHERYGPIATVIHGAARGADSIAAEWASRNGVEVMPFPADWAAHGNAAGPIRNQRMIDEAHPDVVIAFPGGRGTADMVRRAKAAGITVHQIPV